MFIRCPACHTLFRLQPKQLKAARGQVRCGSCQAVFDGLEFLVNREELSKEEQAALTKSSEVATRQWQLPFDDAPPPVPEPGAGAELAAKARAPAESASSEPKERSEPAATPSAPAEAIEAEPMAEAPKEAEPAPSPPDDAGEPPATSEPQNAEKPVTRIKWSPRYSLAHHSPETTPPSIRHRFGWAFATLLMFTVLAGQLAWFNRDLLALDPRWRPWLQQVCDAAGCELPPLRDPHAIEMVDRNVQSHPQYQGALLITATLVNQAPFAQPYPQVELAMTDLDQKRIASRRFLPAEYLDNGNSQGLIQPGASVRLKLEIADPGQEAVGFEFEFY